VINKRDLDIHGDLIVRRGQCPRVQLQIQRNHLLVRITHTGQHLPVHLHPVLDSLRIARRYRQHLLYGLQTHLVWFPGVEVSSNGRELLAPEEHEAILVEDGLVKREAFKIVGECHGLLVIFVEHHEQFIAAVLSKIGLEIAQ